jgi:hypothetical protein
MAVPREHGNTSQHWISINKPSKKPAEAGCNLSRSEHNVSEEHNVSIFWVENKVFF